MCNALQTDSVGDPKLYKTCFACLNWSLYFAYLCAIYNTCNIVLWNQTVAQTNINNLFVSELISLNKIVYKFVEKLRNSGYCSNNTLTFLGHDFNHCTLVVLGIFDAIIRLIE